jgi:signal transduction histidine kinase
MMFRSIRSRLSLSFAGIALVAALVLGAALLAILQNYYRNQEMQYLRGNARTIAQVVMAMLSSSASQEEIQSQIENLAFLSQTRVQVYDPDQQLLFDSGPLQYVGVNLGVIDPLRPLKPAGTLHTIRFIAVGPRPDTTTTPSPGELLPSPESGDTDHFVYRAIVAEGSPFGFDLSSEGSNTEMPRSKLMVMELIHDPQTGEERGAVRLSEGPGYGTEIVQSVARGWALSSVISVLLAAGVGWYLSQRMSAPILALRDVTTRMAQGDLSSRADVRSRDEFEQLAVSFNEMAGQVEKTVTTLRAFVSDAAHELRTPLTVLRTNLDLVLDEKDEARRAAFIADAKAMVQRLHELNTNLLDLSRLEASSHTTRDTVVDLAELLRARSEVYASQAEQAGLMFERDLASMPVFVRANETDILRAVDNLVDNACKFTPQDGIVRISLVLQGGQVLLSVTDTGIGIPEEDLPQLFNRFHRGRNATTYAGSGLGLAIVKAIVSAHGGQVNVQSMGEGRGSKFSIYLPVVKPGKSDTHTS